MNKDELIHNLLVTYHTIWWNSIDSEIGNTKLVRYDYQGKEQEIEISSDDYEFVMEIIRCIESRYE